jgi:hypothetical protein
MHTLPKIIRLAVIFIFLILNIGFPAPPKIQISVDPKEIGVNEQSKITITIDRKADDIAAPKSNAYGLKGPMVSTSFSVNNINGLITQTVSIGYTFVFVPKTKGTIKVGAFSILIDGETYKTKPFEIRVVQASAQSGPVSGKNPFEILDQIYKNNKPKIPEVFLKLIPAKNGVFQGQPLILDAIVFSSTKEILDGQYVETAPIRADKLLIIDLTSYLSNNDFFGVTIGGEQYYGKIIKRYIAYPIETGTLGIMPPQIVAITSYGHLRLTAENIGVDSFKISDDAGLSYIGDLDVRLSVSTNVIAVGKMLEVTLRMEGNGNLKLLANTYKNLTVPGLFISTPQTTTGFKEWRNGLPWFVQTVKYNILAQKPGEFNVPGLKLSYYNLDLMPKKAELPEFRFSVLERAGGSAEIRYFAPKPLDGLTDRNGSPLSPFVWAVIIIFGILPVLSRFYGLHMRKMSSDTGYSRRFLANSRLSKYLTDSRENLKNRRYKEFYLALQKGLFYYITDKRGLPAGLKFSEILDALKMKDLPEDTLTDLKEIYDACSRNAYSGTTDEKSVDEVLEMAMRLFGKI